MTIKILTLPAGCGKTGWVVEQVINKGSEVGAQSRIVLPSQAQVLDVESRLVEAGGVMGAEVATIIELAEEIIELDGIYPLLLPENVQVKVLQDVLEELPLVYYQPIRSKPGFVKSCLDIIRELKSGGISPDAFLNAAKKLDLGPRLIELGLIYTAYLEKQRGQDWMDRSGLIWLACDSLLNNPDLCGSWGSVYLDGFDDLTPMQSKMIKEIAGRVDVFYLTITGLEDSRQRPLVHKRFIRLKELLSDLEFEELDIDKDRFCLSTGPGRQLETKLFEGDAGDEPEFSAGLELAAVPDRESEVRTAFRWIRKKIVDGDISTGEAAILVRSLEPYRGLLYRIAGEYNLPVRLQGGLPLAENPFIAAFIGLARLISAGKDGLVWHEVISIWRSPYLNWELLSNGTGTEYSRRKHLADTKQLEQVARWGRVIQGYSQWEGAFQALIGQEEHRESLDGDSEIPAIGLPRGRHAERLYIKFNRFVDLLNPPAGQNNRERYIVWLEELLGGLDPRDRPMGGLGVAEEILAGQVDTAKRDWQALRCLAAILKEQVWTEGLLDSPPVSFSQFFDELVNAVNKESFQLQPGETEAVLCAGCTEARGLSFKAVAILGLAEGEFPGTIKEDPFIRDRERSLLKEKFNIPLRLSVESAETEYFYEAVTRSSGDLLLTRPRIAENGASWQPSPYWEEVIRITQQEPQYLTTRSVPQLILAGNQSEALRIMSANGRIAFTLKDNAPESLVSGCKKMEKGRDILLARSSLPESGESIYDGNLSAREERIAGIYKDDYLWSASRLESYQSCPFNYFVRYLLGLEKPEQPEEGLDARQRGNIYHNILENLYQLVGEEYTVDDLLESLPEAAAQVFLGAPRREGFRETAWWEHSQLGIIENIKRALVCIEAVDPDFRFHSAEHRFGIDLDKEKPLTVSVEGYGEYLLRGFIDRVDTNKSGDIRIIDYKTSGKFGFDNRSVIEGVKMQLPLYALAAQEALNLGPVKEGFYFHLIAAEPSSFKLSSFKIGSLQGPEAAMKRAAQNGWQAVSLIAKGMFSPKPPKAGCPDYCPAADFCWHYQPKRW